MSIYEITLITSPLKKYLQVDRAQITDLDLQDATPDFEWTTNKQSMWNYGVADLWLFAWTPSFQSQVLKHIADFSGVVRITEQSIPRLHEISWQKTNNVKECA